VLSRKEDRNYDEYSNIPEVNFLKISGKLLDLPIGLVAVTVTVRLSGEFRNSQNCAARSQKLKKKSTILSPGPPHER
jgi:hypothetical protein